MEKAFEFSFDFIGNSKHLGYDFNLYDVQKLYFRVCVLKLKRNIEITVLITIIIDNSDFSVKLLLLYP